MTLPSKINRIIDAGGLLVALAVDLVLNVICMSVLAPDMFTRIAFVAIGIMMVLFVFRSWSKRQYALYAVFVAVVFFFDYSFTLEATRAQSQEITASDDTELQRIKNLLTASNNTLDNLHTQYDNANKAETLRELNSQINATQERIDQYNDDYKTRLTEIESGKHTNARITSQAVFEAIPNAVSDKRFIQLIIYALVFAGLQFIVASSVDNKKISVAPVVSSKRKPKRKRISSPEITESDLHLFVSWNWYRITQSIDTKILSRSVFFETLKKQNRVFDNAKYDYLMNRCRSRRLITADGTATEKDINKVIEVLK